MNPRVVLALLIASRSAVYPLGPFAHVSWHQIFRSTPSYQTQTILGRTYVSFLRGPDQPGGTPAFDQMAIGQVGAHKTWVAAIPLDSGGSGRVFTIAVFRLAGQSAKYIDSISVGDLMSAQVYGGALQVTSPAARGHECEACATHIRLIGYVVDQGRLRKVSETIVQTHAYFQEHARRYFVVGEIKKVSGIGKNRVAQVRATSVGATPLGIYSIAEGLDLTDVSSTEKFLLVCQVNPNPNSTTWIITAIYPYIGGLE